MRVQWTSKALGDLTRLYEFLAPANPRAAARIVQALAAAPDRLLPTPRLGERLDEFSPREVRRLVIGQYEMRYEIRGPDLVILRLWHAREDR
jgi:plasmid stabilization system protein ParE